MKRLLGIRRVYTCQGRKKAGESGVLPPVGFVSNELDFYCLVLTIIGAVPAQTVFPDGTGPVGDDAKSAFV